jgi:hypothetical protein
MMRLVMHIAYMGQMRNAHKLFGANPEWLREMEADERMK